jgi:S-adenosylhomocysteine hydrolase
MAAITYVNPSLVTPTGEARIRRGEAAVNIAKGQAVALNGAPSSARFEARYGLATSETTAIGIALKDVTAGNVVDVLIDGEMGGFAGLTAGAPLSVVNGVLNTTAPAGASLRTFVAYNATTVIVV